MRLVALDWVIVVVSILICFVPALFFGKRAGRSTSEFFASGRSVPWWLAGLSMVATTFSSDTPNWVTQQVRQYGVAGNWQWWAMVLTGDATVFFFARLSRRLPRTVLQLLHHGDGHAGRVKDCQQPVRAATVADERSLQRPKRSFR